jgi:hypothetical protein
MPAGQGQTIWPLRVMPGIKRDGTVFEGSYWTSGEWVRFQRGVPRSIGGYQQVATGYHGPSRGVNQFAQAGIIHFHSGSANLLETTDVDPSGAATAGVTDRTPSGFVTDPQNVWQFTQLWNAAMGANNTALIAHAAPNLQDIDNNVTTKVWYGDVTASTALVDTGATQVSGGVVALPPYLVTYGSNGSVAWSDVNQPTVWGSGDAGSARVTQQKIVKGLVTRGGPGFAPAGLLWSLDSLIRMYFVGSPAIFAFDTISDQSSILSSSAVIEYDSLYYWPGVDRFLMYNGIVREVPNSINLNYFYDNLNRNYAQKVWATKVPRYGEVWWFFPSGSSTECNDAIIYNVRENTWYDAGQAEGARRSAGIYPQTLPTPLWMANDPLSDGTYGLWRHETGPDKIDQTGANAIHSFIETCDISWCGQGPNQQWAGIDRNVTLDSFELDFVQTMPMTLTVKGRAYAQGDMDLGTTYNFGPGTDNTERIKMSGDIERREMRLNIDSNTQGGAWQMGTPLAHFGMGSGYPGPQIPKAGG